jgi:small subunit ribosomal protein S22
MLLLKTACNIFEPNDPEFIRITHRIYEVVNQAKDFEILHSTRFFGTMVFYLTWYKKLDNLLGFLINGNNLRDAVDCIRLYLIVHGGEAKSAAFVNEQTTPEALVEVSRLFSLFVKK